MQRFKPFIKGQGDKGLLINQRSAFDLIAALLKDGILPFTPKPIKPEDLLNREVDFEPQAHQRDAWEKLKQYSNIGVFYPASVGKTFISLYAMSHLKGPHLVVVPTRRLAEQWFERIQAHTQLKPEEYEVLTYQTAIKHAADREWGLKVIDEVHHMPSNMFSKLALIRSRYILGLTASPVREDGREEYIFALTGYPVGLGWEHFKEIGVIKSPVCNVWIVKNFEAKINRLRLLLLDERKTLIFSDSIETGKLVAARFNLPHVYGETKDRLSVIQESPVAVISRVGDEGVSLPDIQRVIEINWLYGSRRQELQRFTRLLHGQSRELGEHHILMTLDEYMHDRKRLFSIMDKGFKLDIHREGVSEESISRRIEGQAEPRPRRARKQLQSPEVSAINGVLALPGVQRIIRTLGKSEARLYELLIRNDGQWFKRGALPLLLGYTGDDSMRHSVDFSNLLERRLIEQRKKDEGVEYRTNLTSRTGGASQ